MILEKIMLHFFKSMIPKSGYRFSEKIMLSFFKSMIPEKIMLHV